MEREKTENKNIHHKKKDIQRGSVKAVAAVPCDRGLAMRVPEI